MSSNKSIIVESFLYFIFFIFVFLLSFRYIRDLFPIPQIPISKSVGYSQYFGYPFYFDNLAIYILILSPISCFIFAKIRRKYFK